MKIYKRFIVLVFLLMSANFTIAQTVPYRMSLQNGSLINASTFQFDVYVVCTGAAGSNFTLTSYQMALTYNSAIVNGGTLSFTYIGGSSGISLTPLTTRTQTDGTVPNLVSGSSVGSQVVGTTPLKLGTFQIFNTATFGTTVFNNLAWDFVGLLQTKVNANVGGTSMDVTFQASHINGLSPYVMTLQNGVQTNATTYSFDVYIASASVDFALTSYQVCLNYNSAIANGGTLSYTYTPASTAMTSCTPIATGIYTDGATSNLLFGSNAGTETITQVPIKIGTFVLSTTALAFGAATPNITWDFAGTLVTAVNLNNTNVTLQANHINSLTNTPLPVELVSFTGTSSGSSVQLDWSTATEVNNYGFDVERKTESSGWLKVGFVKGNGNSNSPKNYSFNESPLGDVKFQYRLKQIDFDGSFKYYDAIDVKLQAPVKFILHQNYPNPFNPTTNIRFELPVESFVTLKIFNILGEEVTSLVNKIMAAGNQVVTFDASKFASGMYIYRVEASGMKGNQAGKFVQEKKMLLTK